VAKRSPGSLPWLGPFLIVLLAGLVPAAIFYFAYFTRRIDAFERRSVRLVSSVARQLQAQIDNASQIARNAAAVLGDDTHDGGSEARRTAALRSYLDIGAKLEPVGKAFGAGWKPTHAGASACRVGLRVDDRPGDARLLFYVEQGPGDEECGVAGLVASQSLERIVAFDVVQRDLDGLLVLSSNGAVLAQHGPWEPATGFHASFVDSSGEPIPVERWKPGAAVGKSAAKAQVEDTLRRWIGEPKAPGSLDHLARTRIGGVDYLAFVVPVRLAAPRGSEELGGPASAEPPEAKPADAKPAGGAEGKAEPGAAKRPAAAKPTADLLLAGLVRPARFRSQALELAPSALVLVGALVAAAILALPYVKIRFMAPHERLRGRDMWALAASIYAGTAIATLVLLHLDARHALLRQMDADLVGFSDEVVRRVGMEMDAAWGELVESAPELAALRGATLPQRAQAQALRVAGSRTPQYLGFDAVFLTDLDGRQIAKRMLRTISTPMVDLGRTDYFSSALQLTPSGRSTDYVFASIDSPTTGRELAVLATPWGESEGKVVVGSSVPLARREGVAVLGAGLRSVARPVAPFPFRFVVLGGDGTVLFRSEGERNRRGNFFDDVESRWLRPGAIAGCDAEPTDARIFGRVQRVYRCPLASLPIGEPDGRPATLLAFYDKTLPEAMATELVVSGLFWCGLTGIACLVAAALARALRRDALDWLWPTVRRARLYLFGAAIAVLFCAAYAWAFGPTAQGRSAWLFVLAPALFVLGLPLAASVAERAGWLERLGLEERSGEGARRLHPGGYLVFGVAALLAAAALPATLAFLDAFRAQSSAWRRTIDADHARRVVQREAQTDRRYLLVPTTYGDATIDCVGAGGVVAPPPAGETLSAAELCSFRDRIWASPARFDDVTAHEREHLDVYAPRGVVGGDVASATKVSGLLSLGADVRASCVDFFAPGPDARRPSRFFSVVATACVSATFDETVRLRELTIETDALPGTATLPGYFEAGHAPGATGVALVLALVGGGVCWLLRSIARRILGLDFEDDGVVDRSEDVTRAIAEVRAAALPRGGQLAEDLPARWLLLRPPPEVLALLARPDDLVIELDAGPHALEKLVQAPAPGRVVVLRALESALGDPEARDRVLAFLRACRTSPVFVSSAVDPLQTLEAAETMRLAAEAARAFAAPAPVAAPVASPAKPDTIAPAAVTRPPRGERLAEWADLLAGFERAGFGVRSLASAQQQLARPGLPSATLRFLSDECRWTERLLAIGRRLAAHPETPRLSRHELVESVLDAASAHYRALWSRCDDEEKLLLIQLAQDGLANPHQPDVLRNLRRRRLVRADPRIRIVNESFRRFAAEAETPQQVARWEHPRGESTSARIRGPLAALAVVVAGLLLFTQQAFVTSTVSFAAGAVGLLGAARGLLARQSGGPPIA